MGKGVALPKMPTKTLLKSSALDPEFVQQRRVALEEYLRAMMKVRRGLRCAVAPEKVRHLELGSDC